jgi:hypothetical protein
MRPAMPGNVNTEANKSETVGIWRRHPGGGIVKMHFKKPDYSKIEPKVDTRRKRHTCRLLGTSSLEEGAMWHVARKMSVAK